MGGTAGKADPNKSTIYIGWLNQEGGQQEIGAAATDGADLAVFGYTNTGVGAGGPPAVYIWLQ